MIIMAKSKPGKHPQKGGHNNQEPVKEKVIVKRKSGCFLALLLLVVIIAALIWLLSHFDIGFFGKDGGGDSSSSGVSDTVDKNTPAETTGEKIIDITVSGSQFFYNDGKTEIDDFISEVKAMEGAVNVRITDNNAYVEYMQDLIRSLEENGIPYTEHSAENE